MTSKKPLISVVMPFYNCEKFIEEAVESILNQTFSDFELILINDASTDKSGEKIQKYLSDPRIVYIVNAENKKITHNLNYGLDIAKADIIARMDGDDVSELTRLQKQYDFLKDNPEVTLVGSYVTLIDTNGKFINLMIKPTNFKEIRDKILYYSPVSHNVVTFRKNAIIKIGKYRDLFDNKYPFPEDIDLWYRLVFNGHIITNIPESLAKYRIHINNVSQNAYKRGIADFILKKQTIKDFKLNLTIHQWFMIYSQFLIGITMNKNQRLFIERIYKKIFLNA